LDEDADDALALLLANGVPAAHPRPSEVTADAPAEEPSDAAAEPESPSAEEPVAAPEAERPEAPAEADVQPGADSWGRRRDGRPSIMSRLTLAPAHEDTEDDALKLHDGVSTETREIILAASQLRPAGQQGPTPSKGLDELLGGGSPRRQQRDAAAGARADRETEQPERQPAKPKRSSIPSWDDIVFGTRGD
jgi:hypothetical protein